MSPSLAHAMQRSRCAPFCSVLFALLRSLCRAAARFDLVRSGSVRLFGFALFRIAIMATGASVSPPHHFCRAFRLSSFAPHRIVSHHVRLAVSQRKSLRLRVPLFSLPVNRTPQRSLRGSSSCVGRRRITGERSWRLELATTAAEAILVRTSEQDGAIVVASSSRLDYRWRASRRRSTTGAGTHNETAPRAR